MMQVSIQLSGEHGAGKTELARELFDFFRNRGQPISVEISSSANALSGLQTPLWASEGQLTLSQPVYLHETFTPGER